MNPAGATRTPTPPGTPVRDAATVMLLRDRPDLHVLMLRRSHHVVFTPGATVFPGGAVDEEDADASTLARVVGLTDAQASREHGFAAGGLAFRVAGVRECFEESGILLARDASTGARLTHDARLDAWRAKCNSGTASFAEVLEAEQAVVDARDLRLVSHWTTPPGAPRRYSTWFFVALAPGDFDGVHDDQELIESSWVRPADALDAFARGEIDLILPTQRSLQALASFDSAATVWAELPVAGEATWPT